MFMLITLLKKKKKKRKKMSKDEKVDCSNPMKRSDLIKEARLLEFSNTALLPSSIHEQKDKFSKLQRLCS